MVHMHGKPNLSQQLVSRPNELASAGTLRGAESLGENNDEEDLKKKGSDSRCAQLL
jgi:hypothetical protein